MKFQTHLFYLLVFFLLNFSCAQLETQRSPSSENVPVTVQQLVDWETQANAVATRSNEIFELNHYEIPLSLLEQDFAADLPQEIKNALLFKKDGVDYVRWVINPEDTKWHLEVRDFLLQNGVDAEPKSHLKGFLTASRSMIAFDPTSGASFSVKVSTNVTGGHWTDKKQTWDDAKQIRVISDWISEIKELMSHQTMVIQNEPLGLGIASLDQGLIVRSLNDVPEGEKYYLPGFSALHTEEGLRIAQLNGADNVVEFWNKNYNQPLARALAEFSAYTGVYYDSPHSQNFLIELDSQYRPTGKIVLRDFGDAYLHREFIKNTDYAHLLDIWEQKNILSKRFQVSVGLLHGNSPPDWLTPNDYNRWAKDFFNIYESKFSEITAISLNQLKQNTLYQSANEFSYYSKSYPTTSTHWKRFIEYANCLSGRVFTVKLKECLELFTRHHVQNSCHAHIGAFLQ